jgi:hypothetical protein
MGPLPIGWVHIHEVTNSKGIAVGGFVQFTLVILVGLSIKPMFESTALGDYVFIIFAVINSVATLVIYLFFKETKGLSEVDVAKVYSKE